MPCTTLLVGRSASADGSPLVARTEDSSAGAFDPKRAVVVLPEDQPRTYTSVLGGRTIERPRTRCATPRSRTPCPTRGSGVAPGSTRRTSR
ncbi:C69 family dipeptidase [Brachybacterium sp. GPGPB12]|uniref:C69 family dipeptidase n=1 Tax=Brachybacterium sp. GPGPB12 TaxID=3023517 RepID=UPI0031345F1F